MTYQIRDRQDGMFEIVIMKPVLAGIFPERETAEQFCAYLTDNEPEFPSDDPASFGQALRDVKDAEGDGVLDDLDAANAEKAGVRKPVAAPAGEAVNLPAIRRSPYVPAVKNEKPRMPVQINPASYWPLSEQEALTALMRVHQGEKMKEIVKDYPQITMLQLRAKWANHKRNLQSYMAEAGPQPCTMCAREFTPSVSNPYTCARCSK